MTNDIVYSLATSGTDIFAGISGRSVWKRSLFEIVGVDEANNEPFKCIVYPNPASDKLNMSISPELIGKEYSVINALGVSVLSSTIWGNPTALSLEDMPRGFYFLHIVGTSGATKFVKE